VAWCYTSTKASRGYKSSTSDGGARWKKLNKLWQLYQSSARLPKKTGLHFQAMASNGKQWQAQLDEHIAYMQHLRERIDGCISCGCLSMNKCPTCNKDDHLGETQSGAILLERD